MTDEPFVELTDVDLHRIEAFVAGSYPNWVLMRTDILTLIANLRHARQREDALVSALREVPSLQLPIWYAVHGPEISPEATPEYRLYEAMRDVRLAVDARKGHPDA